MVRSWGPTPARRCPRAGMVGNRSAELSVGMLSPSSAAEVCGADEGRYNAVAVLPQGASDVQSIRAAQTADPRAKQTRPSSPARRAVRVNSRPGDGDSPGSMPTGRFRWGEVLETFLGQPLLAGLPEVVDHPRSQRGGTGYLRLTRVPKRALLSLSKGRRDHHGPHHLPATVQGN